MPKPTKEVSLKRREKYLEQIALGQTQTETLNLMGLSYSVLDYWRKHVDGFARREQSIKRQITDHKHLPVPDFWTFRRDYIGHRYEDGGDASAPKHQQEWFERVEDAGRTIILQPPRHGKSTFFEDYILWRICKDQTIRCLFLSENEAEAQKRLERVGQYLSDPNVAYRDGVKSIIEDFGPFKPASRDEAKGWASQRIWVAGANPKERDPTVEAKGVQTAIYGGGFDLIVLDDTITEKNQESELMREKWLRWFRGQVMTRLPKNGGQVVIIGTRVAAHDNYGVLLDSPGWDILVQPAVQDDGEALWPEQWPVEALAKKFEEDIQDETLWALVYQQQATDLPDAVFKREDIEKCVDPTFVLGQRVSELLYVMGVDPALTGNAAITVLGLDRTTGARYIVDCQAEPNLYDQDSLIDFILGVAQEYGCKEARIEENAYQRALTRDQRLFSGLQQIGCRLEAENTQTDKYDAQWGVRRCASHFAARRYKIPGDNHPRLQALVNELCVWKPVAQRLLRKHKQDRVISLWLAEKAASRYEQTVDLDSLTKKRVPAFVNRRKYRFSAGVS